MTEKILADVREIDAAAEKAGGYVAFPDTLKANPMGEREFAAIRSYSLKHNKPICDLTKTDYEKIGLKK